MYFLIGGIIKRSIKSTRLNKRSNAFPANKKFKRPIKTFDNLYLEYFLWIFDKFINYKNSKSPNSLLSKFTFIQI